MKDKYKKEQWEAHKKRLKEVEESKRSNLPSPTPLRFSKAERFDG